MENNTKVNILNKLKELDVCIKSTRGIQWLVRCPYCGDSLDPTHGHLSIKIDLSNDDSMVYRCFKCNESGLVTKDFLEDIGITINEDENVAISKINKKYIKRNIFNIGFSDYSVPNGCANKNNVEKLNYINSRLGLNLSFEECIPLKIVFDLFDFMKYNKMDNIPYTSYKYMNFINKNYVGFLSNNNARIIWRCIKNDQNMNRYIKLNIDPNNISNNNFYSILNKIDLSYTDIQNIHIAEGTFDILSILYNVKSGNTDNNIYFAGCGFTYSTVLKHVLNSGIIHSNNLHIYSDNDKSNNDHKKYFNKINPKWFDNIYIHRNTFRDEKDYGVNKDKIIDSIFKWK